MSEFNIGDHGFDDCDIIINHTDEAYISCSLTGKYDADFILEKSDAIALAKHFKLTADDLKG